MGTVYSRQQLRGTGPQRVFSGDALQQIAMPLGGLGAGCLHLGGAGNLQDFCLFNAPQFGHSPMTFAAVHCAPKGGGAGQLRVLEGPVQVPFIYDQARFGNGGLAAGHEGLPHMATAQFRGEFPFAWVALADPAFPLAVTVEGYSPLIPGDDRASGLPAAFLTYQLTNPTRHALRLQFSFNVQFPLPGNLHGHDGQALRGHRVSHRRDGGAAGLYFDSDLPSDDPGRISLAVVSPRSGQKADCAWFRGGWFDALTMLTNRLVAGNLKPATTSRPALASSRSRFGATLFWTFDLGPGERADVPLVYCWHVPNTTLTVGRAASACGCEPGSGGCGDAAAAAAPPAYRPYYATLFDNAWSVAVEASRRHAELRQRTGAFHQALFGSSLPDYVLDAVSANLAILKSPTVLRQADGSLWNWEGSSYAAGCCHGSCTHVWNYAQAIAHLFPALERTLRDQELRWSMDEQGHVTFRAALPTGATGHEFHAAADGQLGGILKLYREWQISGDPAWLEEHYPLARRSLEYCIRTWDPDEVGALIEPHHNTYDIEFWGADVMCTSFYLGALRAAAAMAAQVNRPADAERYTALADRGLAYCRRHLWNGAYFQQQVQWRGLRAASRLESWTAGYSEEALALWRQEGPKYQYGTGCLSDGVIGQWYATLLGLPAALDPAHTRQHLQAIFAHNFRNSLAGHANPQRPGFALNDEPGLLLCTWPRGGKLSLPFPYSDEVWTGIEYQVASHMIYEGLVDEGLTLVRAVRQRYDGRVRNPWNEYECGSYYARALSSWAVLLALTGFRYTAVEARLEVAPRLAGRQGQFLFTAASGWGIVHYQVSAKQARVRVAPVEGTLAVRQVQFTPAGSDQTLGCQYPSPALATVDAPLSLTVR